MSRKAKCLYHNWAEKWPGDEEDTKTQIRIHGHKGILTLACDSALGSDTTAKAHYIPPKGPGVRLKGNRSELLEKQIAEKISDKLHAERITETPEPDYSTTTQRDYCVDGFVSQLPEPTRSHDYKTDQAITYWSENIHRVQGMTAAASLKAPFRKSAFFSTPISERQDDFEHPSEN